MLGRKTGTMSSKCSNVLFSEVHRSSTSSVHRDLNIEYSVKGYFSSIAMFYPSLNYNHWSILSIRISHHLEKLPVASMNKNRSLPALQFICLGKWPERQKGNTQHQEALADLNTWLEEQHLEKTWCLAKHSATGKTFSTGSLGRWEKAASFLISAEVCLALGRLIIFSCQEKAVKSRGTITRAQTHHSWDLQKPKQERACNDALSIQGAESDPTTAFLGAGVFSMAVLQNTNNVSWYYFYTSLLSSNWPDTELTAWVYSSLKQFEYTISAK